MFCPKCGKEVEDDADVCVHCGRALNQNIRTANATYNESKTVIGVVCALFLGLIGLLIGFLMYPEGTVARKTFIKAWVITYVSEIAAGFLIGLIAVIIVVAAAGAGAAAVAVV